MIPKNSGEWVTLNNIVKYYKKNDIVYVYLESKRS